jgi:hypothetical protein
MITENTIVLLIFGIAVVFVLWMLYMMRGTKRSPYDRKDKSEQRNDTTFIFFD